MYISISPYFMLITVAAVARKLGSWVRILLEAWISSVLRDGLITRPRSPTKCLRLRR
jgi:hypothetical protein